MTQDWPELVITEKAGIAMWGFILSFSLLLYMLNISIIEFSKHVNSNPGILSKTHQDPAQALGLPSGSQTKATRVLKNYSIPTDFSGGGERSLQMQGRQDKQVSKTVGL